MFELKERDGLARICELTTPHGKVKTPALLPVINPNQMTMTPREMQERLGVGMIITNSYIIWSTPELKAPAEKSGLHNLLNFDGPIMTDSGTFQQHVYGDVKVDPVEIVRFQKSIGSDIGTILDVFSEPDFTRPDAEEAVNETLRRARASVEERGEMLLAGTVQGGIFEDLRERCARELSDLDFSIHPIGGVVPLLESYRYKDIVDIVIASKKGLNPSRPVHLFGAGHPMLFPLAALLGCDMFDSASYAKYAREERMLFPTGTRSITDLHELACECPVCSQTSLEELKSMPKEMRTKHLAEHNLRVCISEIGRVRNAIHEGSIWELVEMRARAHPSLLEALKSLARHKRFLELYEPASRRGAFFYCGPESYDRPAVMRYQQHFFERYRRHEAKILVGFDEGHRPYSKTYWPLMSKILARVDASFVVASFFGPVPIELDELYPIAQSVIPMDLELEVKEKMRRAMENHAHVHGYPLAVIWEGNETLKFLEEIVGGVPREFDLDLMRCRAVLDLQFGKGAADILKSRKVDIVKSPRTGKIRNVIIDGKHALSMRASDGRFTLKLEGGRLLEKVLPRPQMRVKLEDEPADFASKGNNAMAKFVLDCDPGIRPGDDVMLTDSKDELVAVGRALMTRDEMLAFKRGVAVRIRDSAD